MAAFTLSGSIVDVLSGRIFDGSVYVKDGVIERVEENTPQHNQGFILPGLVDAHVHVESSMLTPQAFAELAVRHGTVASVSDPHEIANVVGEAGIRFMVADGKLSPFKFFFGVPSCVPATTYETAGATLDAETVARLLESPDHLYLSEMMNWPGVLHGDPEVVAKIEAAKALGKRIDGHAPGLIGEQAKNYIAAGITGDHECFSLKEALEKLDAGLELVMIREGSAARNFDALIDLFKTHPSQLAFCTDDMHPDRLLQGHINLLLKRAVAKGVEPLAAIRAATFAPVKHFNLPVGLLQEGDAADLVVVSDISAFEVVETYINGECVYGDKQVSFSSSKPKSINAFNASLPTVNDLQVQREQDSIRAIRVTDGQIVTEEEVVRLKGDNKIVEASAALDLAKLVVLNRYSPSAPKVAFVKNFGLSSGALASTVVHDCHNIIAIGMDDDSILRSIALLIKAKGGISAVGNGSELCLPLPIAGLMSEERGEKVAENYKQLDRFVRTTLGSPLEAPFMTLSFLALLVIPKLKLSDKVGLFDGEHFEPVSLQL